MEGTPHIQAQERIRCGWVGTKSHFIPYHDEEWGVPVHDDRRHFEMLILEGAQAGLSWSTILLRREGYRRAFAEFDPRKVAKFDAGKKASLLQNIGIIRNRLKIESAITNARLFSQCRRNSGRSIRMSGNLWATLPKSIPGKKCLKSPPQLLKAMPSRKILNNGDFDLSGAQSSMPICKRRDWSMTIPPIASDILQTSFHPASSPESHSIQKKAFPCHQNQTSVRLPVSG